MKNIPFFTTELGVASLTLEEITYKQEAYITIQDTSDLSAFIDECAGFCRAAGASDVFLNGNFADEIYPLYARIIRMVCDRSTKWETDCKVIPVTEQTAEAWKSIYNRKMRNVPCSKTFTMTDTSKLVSEGTGYFVYRDMELLGIGKVSGDQLEAIAGCIPGAGEDVFKALMQTIKGNRIYVDVAEENRPAMRLYASLGFRKSDDIIKWYQYEK